MSKDNRARYTNTYEEEDDRKDLSKNLDVVCFVMAIEIDRLIAENTMFKEEVKEIANMRVDRKNYEVQIGDLMEKLNSLQKDNSTLKRDNQNLAQQLKEAQLKCAPHDALIRQLQSQIQLLNTKIHSLTGGDDDFDIEALRKKAGLLDAMTGGDTSLEEMQEMIDELRRKAALYDEHEELLEGRELQDVLDELARLKEQIQEMQKKQKDLEKQLKDTEGLKKKAKEFEDMKKKAGGEDPLKEIDKLRKQLKELEDLKKKLADALAQIELHKKTIADQQVQLSSIPMLQQKIQQLNGENDKKTQIILELQQKLAKLEQELDNLTRLLKDRNKQLEDSRGIIEGLKDENDQLRRELALLTKENQQLKEQLAALQRENQQLKNDLMRLQQENAGLQSRMQQLTMQFEQVSHAADQNDNQLADMEAENDALKSELEDLKDQIDNLMGEIDDLKRSLSDAQDEIESLKRQLEQKNIRIKELEDLLNQKDKAMKDMDGKLKKFTKDQEKLEKLEKQDGMGGSKSKVVQLDGLNGSSRVGVTITPAKQEELLLTYLLVSAENERLNVVLNQTINNYQQVLNELQQLQNKYAELQQRMEELKEQNDDLKDKLQDLKRQSGSKDELERLRKQVLEYENKIALLTMEIQRLKQMNNSSSSQSLTLSQTLRQSHVGQQQYQAGNEDQDISRLKRIIEDQLCLIVLMAAETEQLREAQPRKAVAPPTLNSSRAPQSEFQVGYGRSSLY